ncbi:hypothetical protein BC827DRAFT_560760 [Russula dissimulans]|nr:hypothetical protein BC827DRAFT_560760 [Russula dissimulans]
MLRACLVGFAGRVIPLSLPSRTLTRALATRHLTFSKNVVTFHPIKRTIDYHCHYTNGKVWYSLITMLYDDILKSQHNRDVRIPMSNFQGWTIPSP